MEPLKLHNYLLPEKYLVAFQRLNKCKSMLDGNKRLEEYMRRVRITNDLVFCLKKQHGMQHMTRGGLKFLEMCCEFNLCPKRIFFNAELPGSGILAVMQYLKLRRLELENWCASSYVGEGEGTSALQDEFGLVKKYPERWLMSEENNGDCTNPKMIIDLALKVRERCGLVDLYTQDAGVDASEDYNNQESLNLKLHFGCELLGLMVLADGGTMISKHYTAFMAPTISMFFLLCSLFSRVTVYKPQTSGVTNSEVYWVCQGYHRNKVTPELISLLVRNMDTNIRSTMDPKTLFNHSSFEEFMQEQEMRCEKQINAINKVCEMFKRGEQNIQQQKKFTEAFLARYIRDI